MYQQSLFTETTNIRELPAMAATRHQSAALADTSKLSDTELMALSLGVSQADALAMLHKAGSLRVALQSYKAGRAIIELSTRYLAEELQHADPLEDPDAVRHFLKSKLRDRKSEVFAVIFLDNRHRVIAYEELFFGTIDGASVYPREVVRKVLEHNAAAVLLAHNHPSGNPSPSQADERITRRLQDALKLIDVRVLDHFVIGDQIVSFAERGLL